MSEGIFLSLVLTGRNDNYGGDFRSRLQKSVSNSFNQLTSHKVKSEIIFVNYNPVDNDPIEQFIDWPQTNEFVSVRIITVPNSAHQELVKMGERKDVPVMEYLGKNAGIRRAKGEFILSMNPDIILPAKLLPEIMRVRKGAFYRTDRVDFSGDYFGDHKFSAVYLKGQDYPLSQLSEITGLRFKNAILNKWRTFTPSIKGVLNMLSIPVYYNNIENRIHCNVSGDFMLMHRDHWHGLEAHNENTPISLHVDALMVVQAFASGLKEVVFDSPIFHQEHARRYDAKTENPAFLQAFEMFCSEAKEMLAKKDAKKYNGQDWGLYKFDLPELNP